MHIHFQTNNDDAVPTAQNNANTINGDLNDIDPFKSKKSLANSPPIARKNQARIVFQNNSFHIRCVN